MGKFTEKSKEELAKQLFAGCPGFDASTLLKTSQELVNAYKEILMDNDIIQYSKRGRWYNLPFGIDGEIIDRIMYYKGRGNIFYVKTVGKFYFLPFTLSGEIDCVGRYLDITPLIFGGSDDNEVDKSFIQDYVLSPIYDVLIPEQVTTEVIEKGCVILNDRTQRRTQHIIPMYMKNEPLIDLEAKILALLRTGTMNKVGLKGIKSAGPDDSTKIIQASLSKELFAILGYTYLPIEAGLDTLQELNDVNTNLQELCMILQSIDNLRLNNLGIQNGGVFEKQGTVLQTEAMYGVAPTELLEDDYVYQRQKFCTIANSIYGTRMWYEPVSQMNMDDPFAEKEKVGNQSTATMYNDELNNGNSNTNTNNVKEGA